MTSFVRWTLVLVLIFFSCACQTAAKTGQKQERPAGVAGSFYPTDVAQLNAFIDNALAKATVPKLDEPLIAIIAPHAGYQYSGAIAAYSYALLKGRSYKRVIIIAPSHFEAFDFSSVYDGDAYTTPLGKIPVDREFARKLAKSGGSIRLSDHGHAIGERAEHAIEVQLPFLQKTLAQFTIVPIVMGDQSYEACRELGIALAKLLKNESDTLMVASSDLSHYHPYEEATRMDRKLLNAIEDDDFLTVSNNTNRRVWEACGAAPIITAMIAAERRGASHPKLLKYANSGDVTGDKSRVVGYSAVAFFRSDIKTHAAAFALTEAERNELLRIAIASVESSVRDRKAYRQAEPSSSSLLQERGVFVTLKEGGALRGCIGYIAPVLPLYQAVAEVASHAALRDPRFPPVKLDELSRLQYEISVLSPFAHVLDAQTVRVGEHGLLLRRHSEEGILLPQVPTEQGWDRSTFLEQVSYKAGLARDAWRDDSSDLFSFTALVFSDHEQKGNR